jgi:hypothetical protein
MAPFEFFSAVYRKAALVPRPIALWSRIVRYCLPMDYHSIRPVFSLIVRVDLAQLFKPPGNSVCDKLAQFRYEPFAATNDYSYPSNRADDGPTT